MTRSSARSRATADKSVPPAVAAARNRFHRFLVWTLIFYVRKVRRRIYSWLSSRPLERDELARRPAPDRFWRFGEPETVSVDVPDDFVGEPHHRHMYRLGALRMDAAFVAELHDAVFVYPWCLSFTSNNRLVVENTVNRLDLLDVTLRPKSIVNLYRARLSSPARRPERHLDTVCPLVNCFSTNRNYFHWTLECLPRIEGLEYYQKQTDTRVPVVLEHTVPDFKLETLRLLGLDDSEVLRTERKHYWYRVDNLVVPSVPRVDNHTSPRACRWLKTRMRRAAGVDGARASGTELIYVSRRIARERHVRNEDVVLRHLEGLGFRSYILEELSVADQVRLFSGARVVVGPHGAGFSNVIYGDDLTLVEFFGERYVDPCFFTLARGLGYGYQMQVGPDVSATEIEVDVERMKRQVEAALERQEGRSLHVS